MKSRIKEWIVKRGLKQTFVANEIGVTSQQLSNWINNRNFPPLDKAFKLAKLLGCKVDDLYEANEEEMI